MSELDAFISGIPEFTSLSGKEQVDYLVYHLLKRGATDVSAAEIEDCFSDISIKRYSRLSQYLAEESKKAGGKYLRRKPGRYALVRKRLEQIDTTLDDQPRKVQASTELQALRGILSDPNEEEFLGEVIDCFTVGANRASIVAMWVLTMYHMQNYIISDAKRQSDFNTAISKHADKRMRPIGSYDDFGEMKETRVIELMRSAGLITNDVRKILDEKLGVRNTFGHPTNLKLHPSKTTEYILDLVDNVLKRYH